MVPGLQGFYLGILQVNDQYNENMELKLIQMIITDYIKRITSIWYFSTTRTAFGLVSLFVLLTSLLFGSKWMAWPISCTLVVKVSGRAANYSYSVLETYWSPVYRSVFYLAAAKRRDFSVNATIFRLCVRFVAMMLSKKIVPSNSVVLPVQSRNRFRCLICSVHLFYGFYCVRIGNVKTG